jgi:mRNA-degrading endonuclease RelE of RelBE toxin-antitoxin system
MPWKVCKTESFEKWWKKEDINDDNYKYHKKALEEFRNVCLPHNIQTSFFRNSSFECWATRLPDKVRKQGKSGGFRVVFILDLEDKILLLQGIFRRYHLNYQGQSGKYDDSFEKLVKDLAKEFVQPE